MAHLNLFLSLIILIIGSFTIAQNHNLNKTHKLPFLKSFIRFIIAFNLYFLLQTILEYIYTNVGIKSKPQLFFKVGIYTDFLFSIFMVVIIIFLLDLFKNLLDSILNRTEKHITYIVITLLFACHLVALIFYGQPSHKKLHLYLMISYIILFTLTILYYMIKILISVKTTLSKEKKNQYRSLAFLFIPIQIFILFSLWLQIERLIYFNLAFYLAFLLYNLIPVVFMRKFSSILFPISQSSGESGELIKNLFKKFNISNREQEIINLILEGKSNRDIEETLFISIATVKDHVYKIYKKTRVKNRVQLVNLFYPKSL